MKTKDRLLLKRLLHPASMHIPKKHYIDLLAPGYLVAACGGLQNRAQPLHVSLPLAGYLDRRGKHAAWTRETIYYPKSHVMVILSKEITLKSE